MFDTPRWWVWTVWAAWRGQSPKARWSQAAIPVALIAGLITAAAFPGQSQPSAYVAPAVSPSPSPTPSPEVSPSPEPTDNGPAVEATRGRAARGAAPGCGPVPARGPMQASYFPRVVIPKVGINLEIHPGDGGAPPDHVWVSWFYPGLSQPGQRGNTYIYAHAHGQPENSAPGLFWPIHYMHPCDAVYVYTSPTEVYRYQTVLIDRNHSGYDQSPLDQTTDERVTLQTCNDWAPHGPKTIVVAERYIDPSAPSQPGVGSGSGGDAPPAEEPQPQPSPTSKLPVPLPTHPPGG